MKRSFLKIFNILIITLIIIFKIIDVIYSINYDAVSAFVNNLLGTTSSETITDVSSPYVINSLNNFFEFYFFPIFLSTSFILSIIGTFILTRKKSIYSAMGLLVAFIIPSEKIFLGSVKDKTNSNIIPFAVLRVLKLGKGKEYIKQTVADVDGRYSLYISEIGPEYKLEISASGYEPLVIDIEGSGTRQKAFNITQDIFLSRENLESKKKSFNYNKLKFYKILMWIVYINSILYFLTFIYYVVAWPGEYYGWITVILFTFAVFRNTKVIKQRFFAPKGRFLDKETGKPISGVIVNFFNKGQKIDSQISDSLGIVKSSFREGKYDISIQKTGFKVQRPIPWRVRDQIFFVKIKLDKEGYLKENIFMKNLGGTNSQILRNPFSSN